MKSLTALIFVLLAITSYAQEESCGAGTGISYLASKKSFILPTLPWEGNNDFLENVLQTERYDNFIADRNISGCNLVKFLVPIDVYVWRDATGGNAISSMDLDDILQEVNTLYANTQTGIQFYIRQLNLENSNYYNSGLPNSWSNILFDLFAQSDNKDAINLHFISTGGPNPGGAFTPEFEVESYSAFVRTGSFTNKERANSTSHELGHCLGLHHTHHPGRALSEVFNDGQNATVTDNCYQEPVSRTLTSNCFFTLNELKCEVNGDFLRDTPADPRLTGMVSNTCLLTLPLAGDYHNDNWNSVWTPDIHNIMSYSNRACRDRFSRLQIGVMWYWLTTDFFETRSNIAQINATDLICATSTKTVSAPNIERGVYTWSTSSNLIVSSQTANTAQIKAGNSARSNGKINVQVRNPYSNFCLSTQVWAGKPNFGNAQINGPTQLTPGYSATYYITPAQKADTYNWTIPSGCWYNYCWIATAGQGTTQLSVRAGNTGSGVVQCSAKNVCGSDSRYLYVNVQNPYGGGGGGGSDPCGANMRVSPKKGNGKNISATVIYPPEPCDNNYRNTNYSATVTIRDTTGKIVYLAENQGTEIDITGLKLLKGEYAVIYTDSIQTLAEYITVIPKNENTMQKRTTDVVYNENIPVEALVVHDSLQVIPQIDMLNIVDNEVVLYPNPTHDKLTISSLKQNTEILIYDFCGKLVCSHKTKMTPETIDLAHLQKGIYIVRINEENLQKISKFVKQ